MLSKNCHFKRNLFFIILFLLPVCLQAQEKPDALKCYKNKQYRQAIDICIEEISKTPDNLNSYVVLGWALIANKNYEEAIKWCSEGRKIAKYDSRLLQSLAEAHFYLGHNNKSLLLFKEYIICTPSSMQPALIYYFIGEIYLRMQKYQHADIAFSVAVNLNSKSSDWWARLGYVREQTKEYLYALKAYEQALKLNKNLIEAKKGKERILKFFNN
ncbi:MAG: hypothetical protein CR988_06120 [Treponema sp.]|nr:MAG: hypothetical protein CR988_06120 [Treponema sp.]